MAGETPLTIVGNLTADPELRYTASGVAVANFTVASTPRTYDKQSGGWKDGETLFMRCSVWRDQAEHAAESFRKGNRLVVTGRLVSRSFEDKEGNTRNTIEMQADEVAASVRNATVKVTKAERSSGVDGFSGGGQQKNVGDDPWGNAAPAGTPGQDDEAPF